MGARLPVGRRCKLAEMDGSSLGIRYCSLVHSPKAAQVVPPATYSDMCHPASSAVMLRNAAREVAPCRYAPPAVFLERDRAQIFTRVVQAVAINVVSGQAVVCQAKQKSVHVHMATINLRLCVPDASLSLLRLPFMDAHDGEVLTGDCRDFPSGEFDHGNSHGEALQ